MQNVAGQSRNQTLLTTLLSDPSVIVRRVNVPAGTMLYDVDSPAQNLYVIHRGQVREYQIAPGGETRLVEILGPNEWFGVGALANNSTYGARAIAVENTAVSEVLADRALHVLTQRPEALLALTRQLADRVVAAKDDAAKLIFDDCRQRLVRSLIHFSKTAASTPHDDGVVLHLTHGQLAQAIGVARETVSITLTQLKQQNLLKTGRNRLFFDPEILGKAEVRRRATRREIEPVEAA
jgi:CRP/FNR family transcriptional regulator, cyclic AMP receptor protein